MIIQVIETKCFQSFFYSGYIEQLFLVIDDNSGYRGRMSPVINRNSGDRETFLIINYNSGDYKQTVSTHVISQIFEEGF